MVNDLDYEDVIFPVAKKDHCKTEQRNKISIDAFYYENHLVYPVFVSDKAFEKYMDLLLITDEIKSHYVYIKDFDRLMCNKTRTRNIFQYFSSGNVFQQNKKICLKIGGKRKADGSHNKWKDTLKTRAVFIEVHMLS